MLKNNLFVFIFCMALGCQLQAAPMVLGTPTAWEYSLGRLYTVSISDGSHNTVDSYKNPALFSRLGWINIGTGSLFGIDTSASPSISFGMKIKRLAWSLGYTGLFTGSFKETSDISSEILQKNYFNENFISAGSSFDIITRSSLKLAAGLAFSTGAVSLGDSKAGFISFAIGLYLRLDPEKRPFNMAVGFSIFDLSSKLKLLSVGERPLPGVLAGYAFSFHPKKWRSRLNAFLETGYEKGAFVFKPGIEGEFFRVFSIRSGFSFSSRVNIFSPWFFGMGFNIKDLTLNYSGNPSSRFRSFNHAVSLGWRTPIK